jgi:hypothetical protein
VSGTISAADSLVGTDPSNDRVGSGGVTALANGNYVVSSPLWKASAGAATWGDGRGGTSGIVSSTNSLVGSNPNDQVSGGTVTNPFGISSPSYGVHALPNGNYVVLSPFWTDQGGAGAATWGNGTAGTDGTVSSANSLTNFPGLNVSNGFFSLTALPNGNYVVLNAPGTAVSNQSSSTWVDGTSGTTLDGQNTPDAQNSFLGSGEPIGIVPLSSGNAFLATDTLTGQVAAGITDPNLLTYALGEGQTITITPGFLTRSLDAGSDVTLQANDDISVDSPVTEHPTGTAGSLTLQAGRSIVLGAGINTAGGDLTLTANDTRADGVIDTERDPGDANITEQSGATINTGGGALTVDLKDGTDKTNNGRGTVTLPQVSAGSETLSPASTVGITITGTTPGDGITAGSYTQLNVAGSVNLNGAALAVTYSASTPVGTTFTIVQTTAGISGTFGGLSEGATVTAADGTQFRISYQGNGGKDVVLTQLTVIPMQLVVTTQPPDSVAVGGGFGLMVKAEDASGNLATSFTGSVTLALADNPGGSTLGGMFRVSAVNGVATFSGLTLDQPGTGYTLTATGGGLAPATTSPFDVTGGGSGAGGGGTTGGGGGGSGGGSASPRGITARFLVVKVHKKRKLMVEVLFADTGALDRVFPSPFQKPAFKNIQVSVRASNGDGVPDEVVLTARKGKKTVTQVFPG